MYFYLYNETILVTSSVPLVTDKHKEITKEEYNEIAISRGLTPYKSETELIIEEQAELLQRRSEAEGEELEEINSRLDEIADYWDSLEGQVATYGTDN